jgi:hypothetical protein
LLVAVLARDEATVEIGGDAPGALQRSQRIEESVEEVSTPNTGGQLGGGRDHSLTDHRDHEIALARRLAVEQHRQIQATSHRQPRQHVFRGSERSISNASPAAR